MVAQDEQERMKHLLSEALPMLCKSGLKFSSEFCVEALIGITLDKNDVLLVSIKETVKSEKRGEKSIEFDVKRSSQEIPNSNSAGKVRRKRSRVKNASAGENDDSEGSGTDGQTGNKRLKKEHGDPKASSVPADNDIVVKLEPEELNLDVENTKQEDFTSDFPVKSLPVFPVEESSLSLASDTSWQESSFSQTGATGIPPTTSQEGADGSPADLSFMVYLNDKNETNKWLNSCVTKFDDATWQCDICAVQFTSKSHVRSHIKIVHLKERKYECPYCLRKFGKKNDRIRHEKICKFKPREDSTEEANSMALQNLELGNATVEVVKETAQDSLVNEKNDYDFLRNGQQEMEGKYVIKGQDITEIT